MTAPSGSGGWSGRVVERRSRIDGQGIGFGPKQSLGDVELLIYPGEYCSGSRTADKGVMLRDCIKCVGRACRCPDDILEGQLQAAVVSRYLRRCLSGGLNWMKSVFWCEPQACSMADRAHPGLGGRPGLCNIELLCEINHKMYLAKRCCSKASLFMPRAIECLVPVLILGTLNDSRGRYLNGYDRQRKDKHLVYAR